MRRGVSLIATVASILAPHLAVAQDSATPAPSAAASTTSTPALTPSKDECADAYEQSQRLRKAYKLRAAHEQLLVCAAASCPAFMKQDCAKWLGEVESSTPTVVLLARDADGSALVDVHVTIDGQPLSDKLDGRAIAVDPGAHEMHYEVAGKTLDERVVVAEGARNQQIVADFGRARGGGEAPSAPPPPAASPRIPAATWVLGGVAAIGAVSFAAFAVAGRSVQSCAPDCTRSQVDELRRDYLVADVSWITGLVAAGAALVVYLTAPAAPPASPAATAAALRW